MTPNAQLAVFPAAGHFLIMQGPQVLFPPIAAFLDAPLPGEHVQALEPPAGTKP